MAHLSPSEAIRRLEIKSWQSNQDGTKRNGKELCCR